MKQATKLSMFAAIVSDVHLWVPLGVLLGGVCLLIALR
jgi:hypothetical protein